MRFLLGVLLAASVLLAPFSSALAADAPSYPVPAKPDFTSMSFLLGTWHCSRKSSRRPVAVASVDTWSLDPTGFYLRDESKSDASPWFRHATVATSLVTYDDVLKEWGEMDSSDVGGFALETSKGWTGNTMVWHLLNNDPAYDVTSSADLTITKISDTSLTTATSFTTTNGKTVGVEGSCSKA